MPIDRQSATHVCNAIKRQIQEEYPELNLNFILHEEGKRKKAIAAAAPYFQDHPAGNKILRYITKSQDRNIRGNRTCFIGLAEHYSSGFLNFFRSYEVLAPCFVNYDRFNSVENLRNHVYYMVWLALELHRDIKEGKDVTLPNGPDGIIIANLKPLELYHRNLTADIFSATLQALIGQKTAIHDLALHRMNDTLLPQKGYIAETFPFPISLETLDFLFSESMKNKKRESPLPQAVKMTREIGMTYKPQSLQQWRSFALPAQEMAWSGHDPETILGAALYSSENTYVRAIADMVSEHTGIKPQMITTTNSYNPFTKQEANRHLHEKTCQQTFNNLIYRIRGPQDYKIFVEEAARQNKDLSECRPTGWCAHALLCVALAIEKSSTENSELIQKEAEDIFKEMSARTSWTDILHFSRTVFMRNREGLPTNPVSLINIAARNPEYKYIRTALEKTTPKKSA
ncbi:MAG: hypothetical protein KDI13_08115 [Alphaproteobacteria bacterium]|nr:hypothetical protein [Alphaproteobacteria bacterium]